MLSCNCFWTNPCGRPPYAFISAAFEPTLTRSPAQRHHHYMANMLPSSPVLRVFVNDDLLHMIFTSLKTKPRPSNRTLAVCARVCRAFYGPAIGLLWQEMDTILPLWHLLEPPPSDDDRSCYGRDRVWNPRRVSPEDSIRTVRRSF